jgi:hypothetical protein
MIEASSAWMAVSISRGGRDVPYSAMSVIQKIRAQQTCPLLAKETVLGPGKAEEPENGATVEGPVHGFLPKAR